MDFKTIATALATNSSTAGLSAADVVTIANVLAVEPIRLNTHDDLVAFARTLPAVSEALDAANRILAIKELRSEASKHNPHPDLMTGLWVGLKAATDAVDVLWNEHPDSKVITCEECGRAIKRSTTWVECPHNAHNHG